MKAVSIWLFGIFLCIARDSMCVRESILKEVVDDDLENELFSDQQIDRAKDMRFLDEQGRMDNDNDDDNDDRDERENAFAEKDSSRSPGGKSKDDFYGLCYESDLVEKCLNEISCKVSLPNCISDRCRKVRQHDLAIQKKFYALSKPVSNPTGIDFGVPVLDKSFNATLRYFMMDKFSAHWFNVYFVLLLKPLKTKLLPMALSKFAPKDFTTYEQYFQVSDFYRKSIQSFGSSYFKFPSSNYKYFTDMRSKRKFLKDKYFIEQRLAGINPMTIRRVTLRGKIGTNWKNLKTRLNLNFKWGKAIAKITRRNLLKSIKYNYVYVVEFPLLSGLPFMPDPLNGKSKGNAKMRNDTNPIAIFASHKNLNGDYELKVVAIQIDDKPTSPVYTPSDGYLWELAKSQVQASDGFTGHFYEHLLRTHLRMEPICVGIYRHLSKLHPLHEILKFHCRGLIALNKNGMPALLNYTKAAHVLISYGNLGAAEVVRRGKLTSTWSDINIRKNVKERGMDDRRKIPFYPYRDDGEEIDQVLRKFSRRLVRKFYKRNSDVTEDYELQNLINELSADGKIPPYNGMGQIKGLKPSFKTRLDVENFLHATLWIIVQHSAIGMPVGEYGKTLYWPTKMYLDPRAKKNKNFVYMLPGGLTSVLQAQLSYSLASLHYDSLFDYYKELQSPVLRKLVEEAYVELMFNVKPMFDSRNAWRMKNGHLTNPYMVPGWITNSIST